MVWNNVLCVLTMESTVYSSEMNAGVSTLQGPARHHVRTEADNIVHS